MRALSIGDLVLVSDGVPTSGFLIQTPIEGLDGPNHRTNAYAKAGRDGQTISSQFYDARLVTFVGKVYGDTFAEFETNRKALIAATAISRDDNGFPEPIRVSFTTMAEQEYYFDAYFDKPELALEDPITGEFMVTAVCTDPFIYAQTGATSSAISPPSGGGWEIPTILPFTSAASSGGSVTLNNAGSVTAWPIITLTGPLTTPVLTNTTTGTYLQLDYTIAMGDEVIIDMIGHTITLDGASLISTKTAVSEWWGLEPGNNSVTLTTSSSSDEGSMTVAYNVPYIGV
ncbi:phage distal tail protein [Mycolicibacterium sp. S3B2]|uniref:phage distal tail protein n=1 Tax=Mycolicibacterium sp. S3B2 TaxID=3415120 RepID=UPI003C7BEB10